MFIDTHSHLQFDQFDNDREKVIQRAIHNKIESIITIGTDVKSSKKALELANKFAVIFAAAGIHPNDSLNVSESDLIEIETLLKNKKILAIGEIGLDYYRLISPKEQQIKIFRIQIEIAKRVQKPVIIHNREAHDDLLNVLVEEKIHHVGGVLHSFSGSEDFLESALKHHLYISFTGIITFRNSHYYKLIDRVPLDQLLLETDSPFLAPEPFRGRRNEPSYLKYTAEKIAKIKGTSVEKLAQVSSENARTLFQIET
jgi:TatD DNase family protein